MFRKLFTIFLMSIMSFSLVACGGASSGDSETNEFPSEDVTMVIPWGSGGNADLFARNAMNIFEENVNQSTVVENRTGAGGETALTQFAGTQPGYHELITTSASNFSLLPQVKEVGYSREDFKPVIGAFFSQFILMSSPSQTGIESLEDLQEYAKDNKITFGSTNGPGGDTYTIQAALFKEMGIEAEHVVFDGGMELINNLRSGNVDVTLGIQPLMDEYLQEGELVGIGSFSPEAYELEGIEPIPSLNEQGYDVTYRSLNFFNVSQDTPDEVVDKANEEFNKVYESDEFKEFIESNSLLLAPMSPEEINEFIDEQESDMERFLEILGE